MLWRQGEAAKPSPPSRSIDGWMNERYMSKFAHPFLKTSFVKNASAQNNRKPLGMFAKLSTLLWGSIFKYENIFRRNSKRMNEANNWIVLTESFWDTNETFRTQKKHDLALLHTNLALFRKLYTIINLYFLCISKIKRIFAAQLRIWFIFSTNRYD